MGLVLALLNMQKLYFSFLYFDAGHTQHEISMVEHDARRNEGVKVTSALAEQIAVCVHDQLSKICYARCINITRATCERQGHAGRKE